VLLGLAWLIAGEPARAADIIESNGLDSTHLGTVIGVLALYELGREDEFEAAFRDRVIDAGLPPEEIAIIAAHTGKFDLAFESLEQLVDTDGIQPLAELGDIREYLLTPLRSDARWDSWRERHGLRYVDYSDVRFNPSFPKEVETLLAGNAPEL
jgi:hypothetical protein